MGSDLEEVQPQTSESRSQNRQEPHWIYNLLRGHGIDNCVIHGFDSITFVSIAVLSNDVEEFDIQTADMYSLLTKTGKREKGCKDIKNL